MAIRAGPSRPAVDGRSGIVAPMSETETTEVPTTALEGGPSRSLVELGTRYLDEYLDKIGLATSRLSEDQLWWRPHANALSVGNLLLHLRGNLSLWILEALGERAYERDRAGEFTADRSHSKEELLALLAETVAAAHRVLGSLSDADLEPKCTIQGYATDRRSALVHAVEHMSYHTGQIVYVAKALTSSENPFDFYPRHAGE